MSSKKTTKTSQTVTPTNPEWVTNSVQGLAGQIGNLANVDPFSFVAGPDALQTAAAGQAANLNVSPVFDRIANTGANTAGSASLLDGLANYMNPYTDSVVNTSLAGFDQNAGLTKAQQQLDLANDATFGGSGGSILRALTEGQLELSRGQLESGIRSDGFKLAADLADRDASRRQQTNLFNAGQEDTALARQLSAASAGGAENRANIGMQADIGSILQALAQQRASAPLNLLQMQTGLQSQLPYQLFNGSETESTQTSKTGGLGSALGSLGGLAMGLGALGFAPLTGGLSLGALGGLGGLGSAAKGG